MNVGNRVFIKSSWKQIKNLIYFGLVTVQKQKRASVFVGFDTTNTSIIKKKNVEEYIWKNSNCRESIFFCKLNNSSWFSKCENGNKISTWNFPYCLNFNETWVTSTYTNQRMRIIEQKRIWSAQLWFRYHGNGLSKIFAVCFFISDVIELKNGIYHRESVQVQR